MQPPPRKGNYLKFVKNIHSEQVTKLQLKNQHECDLLEDIRQFTIKRSAIEKSYSESLLKLSSAYLNKKIPNIPDIKLEGVKEERWNMWSVWRTVLEENEKLARARLAAIEVFQQQISDEAKLLREYKLQISKKCLNQIVNVQKELHFSVSDLDKTKKQYFDEEHCAHDVRDKARDIEEKLKKKKGSFFQSITSLQKNSARVTSRKEMLEEKSTGARNDYILSLAAANAHQNRYFTVDLQTTMTTMENYVYERVAEYLTLMGRTELLTCSATQNSFGKIRDQAHQLTREYNLQCCYLFYPVLKQHITYDFEPCDNDPVKKVTCEHESANETLSKEAKNLAARVVRENNVVRDSARKLAVCVNDPPGPDYETKIDEFKENIRRAETEKAKAEACLECLRVGGINVDDWVREAETLVVQELNRSASSISLRTDDGQGEHASSDSFYDSDKDDEVEIKKQTQVETSAPPRARTPDSDSEAESDNQQPHQQQQQQQQQFTQQNFADWSNEDPTAVNWGNEPEPPPVVSSDESAQKDIIYKCTALYSYTAQNPDELTIVENEQLEVIGEGDGDGWLRARNYKGDEGYVPHNYLDIDQDQPSGGGQSQLQTQMSFSSVDYTVDNEDQTQDSQQSPDQVSVIMAPGVEAAAAAVIQEVKRVHAQQAQKQVQLEQHQPQHHQPQHHQPQNHQPQHHQPQHHEPQQYQQPEANKQQKKERPQPGEQEYCIAMYDYDATAEDELTFEEGQIIKIITKTAHGVDDGWWEGEINGQLGNFPSLVVEECDENGEPFTYGDEEEEEEEEETPPGSGMPSFSLPAPPPLPPGYENSDDFFQSQEDDYEYGYDNDDVPSGPPPSMPPPSMPPPIIPPPSGPPPVIIEEEPEESSIKPSKLTVTNSNGGDLGLGAVQINVTAATPMVEDADKSFFPEDKEITEELSEDDNSAAFDDLTKQTNGVKQISNVETEPVVEQFAAFEDQSVDNDNKFETNFEVNFDDAFGEEEEENATKTPGDGEEQQPKQVVGGRASIPEELEPDQLARLQNLKESNA